MLIIKDKDEKNVTKGAYEQFYKPLGYKPYKVIEAVYTEKIDEPKIEEPKVQKTIVENDKEKVDKEKHVTGNKSSNKNKKGE